MKEDVFPLNLDLIRSTRAHATMGGKSPSFCVDFIRSLEFCLEEEELTYQRSQAAAQVVENIKGSFCRVLRQTCTGSSQTLFKMEIGKCLDTVERHQRPWGGGGVKSSHVHND